jgi:hypothetical protein
MVTFARREAGAHTSTSRGKRDRLQRVQSRDRATLRRTTQSSLLRVLCWVLTTAATYMFGIPRDFFHLPTLKPVDCVKIKGNPRPGKLRR